jgi:putative modified peptide
MNDAAAFQGIALTESFGNFQSSERPTKYVLSKAEAIALLERLSTDDAFRARYAARPAEILLEVGVSAETVAGLDDCLRPAHALAEKSVFGIALEQLRRDTVEMAVCLHPPTIRLKAGV